ncbi:MAG: hypothetical protein AAF492_09760, partial [Verrucomicrobiota bacterium]
IVDKGGRVPAYWIEWLEIEGPLYDDRYKNKRRELLLGKDEQAIDESVAAEIFGVLPGPLSGAQLFPRILSVSWSSFTNTK